MLLRIIIGDIEITFGLREYPEIVFVKRLSRNCLESIVLERRQ